MVQFFHFLSGVFLLIRQRFPPNASEHIYVFLHAFGVWGSQVDRSADYKSMFQHWLLVLEPFEIHAGVHNKKGQLCFIFLKVDYPKDIFTLCLLTLDLEIFLNIRKKWCAVPCLFWNCLSSTGMICSWQAWQFSKGRGDFFSQWKLVCLSFWCLQGPGWVSYIFPREHFFNLGFHIYLHALCKWVPNGFFWSVLVISLLLYLYHVHQNHRRVCPLGSVLNGNTLCAC